MNQLEKADAEFKDALFTMQKTYRNPLLQRFLAFNVCINDSQASLEDAENNKDDELIAHYRIMVATFKLRLIEWCKTTGYNNDKKKSAEH